MGKKKNATILAEKQNWTKMGLLFSERKICARKPRFWARGGGLSNTEIKWIKSIFIKAKKVTIHFLVLSTVNNI